MNVSIDIVETESMDISVETTEVEIIIVSIADSLHSPLCYRFVLEKVDAFVLRESKHIEGHTTSLVGERHEGPVVLRHRLATNKFIASDFSDNVTVLAYVQCEVANISAQVHERSCIVPVQPEVEREVTFEEHRVLCSRLFTERIQMQCHLVVHLLTVEFSGNNNILVAYVTRHDILVKLDSKLVTVTQDTVGRRWGIEVTRTSQIFGYSNDVAVYADKFCIVWGSGKSPEFIVTLRITQVARHILSPAQVALCRQCAETGRGRVCLVSYPCVQVDPLRIAGKTILHTDILQFFELSVEPSETHL